MGLGLGLGLASGLVDRLGQLGGWVITRGRLDLLAELLGHLSVPLPGIALCLHAHVQRAHLIEQAGLPRACLDLPRRRRRLALLVRVRVRGRGRVRVRVRVRVGVLVMIGVW